MSTSVELNGQPRRSTLRELFAYSDWARDEMLQHVRDCTEAELDQPFEISSGSLRKVVQHCWGAESVWLDRWKQRPLADTATPLSIGDLARRWHDTASERNAMLDAANDPHLHQRIAFTNAKNESYAFQLGDMMLHVCNHGSHHRAHALNILRRLGRLPPPWLDYLAFVHKPRAGAYPTLQLRVVREYLAYNRWAMHRILDALASCSDSQLDTRFEMGLGTIRLTLTHICFAERWWLQNWTRGPHFPFAELPQVMTIGDLRACYDEVCAQRDAYLADMKDDDLGGEVAGQVSEVKTVRFPLGATLLQLCAHGTHHRAQVLTMMRQLNIENRPGLDLILWVRDEKGTA